MAKRCRQDETVRVYLCGSVSIECGGHIVRDGALGGRQGRLVFVFLMSRAPHPVSREELARSLWKSPPPSADAALNAITSKLRRVLRTAGVEAPHGIVCDVGTYRLTVPSPWVDVDVAVQRVPVTLARIWRRALLVLSDVSTRNEEHELRIQYAGDVVAAEPFDELACQTLMRAHAAAGNRAEALRVYAKCGKLFRDELGAEPSAKTAGVLLSILKCQG